MQTWRSSKTKDTQWYLGVKCAKCKTPILFAVDRGDGSGQVAPMGRLVLTCSSATCRAKGDYTTTEVSRFQKDT